jgi:hypothetical protein
MCIQCRRWGRGRVSRYQLLGPGGPKRGPGSAVFRMYFSFSVVCLFFDGTKELFQTKPNSLCRSDIVFRFSVKIFSRSALAGVPENFFSPGPIPALVSTVYIEVRGR